MGQPWQGLLLMGLPSSLLALASDHVRRALTVC